MDDPAAVSFTLIFVALPLLYVVALSFSTADGGYGVNWKFTLDNYKQILEPVYLQTFTGSFRLALTSTLIICLVGYPSDTLWQSFPRAKRSWPCFS